MTGNSNIIGQKLAKLEVMASFIFGNPNMFLALHCFAGKNLKVKQPEKYNWDPKWMLDHLIDIYLHLDTKTLAAALANDQRSFSGL